ncbi:MAG: cation transporter [Candidatus Riflebacteria bacterium]|nr:cation transporter [Candidatus Riflebacteria bacterium]
MAEIIENDEQNEIVSNEVRKVTIHGLILNILLTLAKIIVGFFAGSSSVIADGVHSLTDCSTDIAVIVGVKYWNKGPDTDHPYGHRRIEAMTTVFIGVMLLIAGLVLIYSAIIKIHSQTYTVPEWAAFIVAILSIITKEALYRWTYKRSIELKCNALKANAWHHRSDAFSSVPVAIAIVFAKYDASWAVLDPIASVAVSFFILKASYDIAWPALLELSDSGANEDKVKLIQVLVSSVEGVKSLHNLRTRFQGNGIYVDLHIQVDPNITVKEGHAIAGRVKHLLLKEDSQIIDVLVHLEPSDE